MEFDRFTVLIVGLPAIIIAIALHEAMHAWVSYRLGDSTAKSRGRVTLNPLAHIDPIMTVALPFFLLLIGLPPIGAARPVPFNPSRLRWREYGMALVALAGPLTNLGLAVLGSLIYRASIGGDFFGSALLIFINVNIVFFIFNMIPFPPLDGSRVLYAIAPDGVRALMNILERFGVFLIILIFLFAQPLISPFLHWANELVINFLL